ncbi:DUF4147 domain-containing protein, partial [Candidatus Bathyarchaeota archaeon]|nr:DUF4147 domain-containing protein [Candidatus Bathyarchaeota archaeon]
DVVGDAVDVIASGPTAPDTTTFPEAIKVLKKYSLWDKTPQSIKEVLKDGERGILPETPKPRDRIFERVYNLIIGNNRNASLAACKTLANEGLNVTLLTSTLEGEARHVGTVLASICQEISISGNPIVKPAGIVVGGETTVTVTGKGLGGRNQELVLSAALKLQGLSGVALASLNTDGVDGPTDAAGALADGETVARAEAMGLSCEQHLSENDSYTLFSKLGDLIITGPTGTNVNDVAVMIVL